MSGKNKAKYVQLTDNIINGCHRRHKNENQRERCLDFFLYPKNNNNTFRVRYYGNPRRLSEK